MVSVALNEYVRESLDGRHLWATHWDDSIGYNSWADASVVFLFDEFFIPKGQVIATAKA